MIQFLKWIPAVLLGGYGIKQLARPQDAHGQLISETPPQREVWLVAGHTKLSDGANSKTNDKYYGVGEFDITSKIVPKAAKILKDRGFNIKDMVAPPDASGNYLWHGKIKVINRKAAKNAIALEVHLNGNKANGTCTIYWTKRPDYKRYSDALQRYLEKYFGSNVGRHWEGSFSLPDKRYRNIDFGWHEDMRRDIVGLIIELDGIGRAKYWLDDIDARALEFANGLDAFIRQVGNE